jgi:hypothetical protein
MKALVSKTIKKEHKNDNYESTINAEDWIDGIILTTEQSVENKRIYLNNSNWTKLKTTE